MAQTPPPASPSEWPSAPPLDGLRDAQSDCWARGEKILVEQLLQREPALAGHADRVLDLIYHEVLLRARHNETPTLDEYLARFPHLEGPLREQFALLRGLLEDSGVLRTRPGTDSAETPAAAGEGVMGSFASYDILAELGRGGMGVVYQARHRGLNRVVALKVLQWTGPGPEQKQARLRAEAEALARLQHPNIVQIYEIGEHEGRPFLALEYVAGGSLERFLGGTPQPPRQAAALVATLARAIDAAHQKGVIHRDLKPANILLIGDRGQGTGNRQEERTSSLFPVPCPLYP